MPPQPAKQLAMMNTQPSSLSRDNTQAIMNLCKTPHRLLSLNLFILLCQAIACIAQDGIAAEKIEDGKSQSSGFVYDFTISLPGGIVLSHDGASNVPGAGYVLQESFKFPKPSMLSLPPGTTIFQEANQGWKGLRFVLPDGAVLRPDKTEAVGVEVRDHPREALAAMFGGPSDIAQHYIDKLNEIKEKTGRAPTLNEFRKLLTNTNPRLSIQDYRFVQAAFITMQSPQLTLEDIRILRASLRNSISTFRASWTVEHTWNMRVDPSVENFKAGKFDFWMDSGKLRYDARHGIDLNSLQVTEARSYDGNVERVFDSDATRKGAVIHPLISVSYYFHPENPLWLAKLIDTQRDLGKTEGGLENFQNRYAYPLEEAVVFNGADCVPLVEQDTVYYLDPKRNYAFCGMEAGRYFFDQERGGLIESGQYAVHFLDGLKDCGDGIWIPTLSTETKYTQGTPDSVKTIKVSLVEVNQPIDASIFEQVVPSGVDVFDGTRGIAYVQGRSKTVENNVERAIEPRRSPLALYVIAVNLAVSGVAGAYFGWPGAASRYSVFHQSKDLSRGPRPEQLALAETPGRIELTIVADRPFASRYSPPHPAATQFRSTTSRRAST